MKRFSTPLMLLSVVGAIALTPLLMGETGKQCYTRLKCGGKGLRYCYACCLKCTHATNCQDSCTSSSANPTLPLPPDVQAGNTDAIVNWLLGGDFETDPTWPICNTLAWVWFNYPTPLPDRDIGPADLAIATAAELHNIATRLDVKTELRNLILDAALDRRSVAIQRTALLCIIETHIHGSDVDDVLVSLSTSSDPEILALTAAVAELVSKR